MDGYRSRQHPYPHHGGHQSPQLPPPSQLHLSTDASGFTRTNTLPPISNLQPPPSHHSIPSNSNGANGSSRSGYPYTNGNGANGSSGNHHQQQLPSLPAPGAGSSWGHHRTSSSRDELHPSHYDHPPPPHRSDSSSSRKDGVKRESLQGPFDRNGSHHHAQHAPSTPVSATAPPAKDQEDGMPATSDFVKKLFKMLEDPSFAHTVCWAPGGDSFVVKDMNEFTKSILPRMFKHSNFASFVRQLNKYDFHKVKNTDDSQFGEHSWTFRHPDFHADRRDALENIKRKVPTQRKSMQSTTTPTTPTVSNHVNPLTNGHARNTSSTSPDPSATGHLQQQIQQDQVQQQQINVQLQQQVDRMVRSQEEMGQHVRNLERNYQDVLSEMVTFQRNMAQQDGLMQNLIQYFLQVENGKAKVEHARQASTSQVKLQPHSPSTNGHVPSPGTSTSPHGKPHAFGTGPLTNPFLPTQEAQRMMGGSYPENDVARASLEQMNAISRRAEVAGMSFAPGGNASGSRGPSGDDDGSHNADALKMMANAAGLVDGMVDGGESKLGLNGVKSRQEALARIEELHRSRPSSAQGQDSTPSFGVNGSYELPFDGGNPSVWNSPAAGPGPPGSSANAVMGTVANGDGSSSVSQEGHEGLRVFTMGHLMPKSTNADENGNWTFDPESLGNVVPSLAPSLAGSEGTTYHGATSGARVAPPTSSTTISSTSTPTTKSPSVDLSVAPPTKQPITFTSTKKPGSGIARPTTAQKLRVRRSTFVPGWAVPPRVLLVDDDEVNRRMSSKFLQVFGCTIDVAVDGVGAVERMNLEKYDLVLMDIVMPKLDGISATSMIRQFDHMTPIISMTSNSKPNEIMTYYSSGMNDILPKPFTQDGLLDMLEKHLMHLKVIQQMAQIPRSVGIPPLSDSAFDQAIAVGASNNSLTAASGEAEADGRINPLAGMGLTDEQYTMILQNLVNGETFPGVPLPADPDISGMSNKRGLDDDDDGRDGKRGRFEVIE